MFKKKEDISEVVSKTYASAKNIVLGISFVVATFTGAYTIVSEYFVTKVYATEMVQEVKDELTELKKQTSSNKKILIEMRLIRIESKIAREEKLTPTEARVYEKLKKDYEKLNEF